MIPKIHRVGKGGDDELRAGEGVGVDAFSLILEAAWIDLENDFRIWELSGRASYIPLMISMVVRTKAVIEVGGRASLHRLGKPVYLVGIVLVHFGAVDIRKGTVVLPDLSVGGLEPG